MSKVTFIIFTVYLSKFFHGVHVDNRSVGMMLWTPSIRMIHYYSICMFMCTATPRLL